MLQTGKSDVIPVCPPQCSHRGLEIMGRGRGLSGVPVTPSCPYTWAVCICSHEHSLEPLRKLLSGRPEALCSAAPQRGPWAVTCPLPFPRVSTNKYV